MTTAVRDEISTWLHACGQVAREILEECGIVAPPVDAWAVAQLPPADRQRGIDDIFAALEAARAIGGEGGFGIGVPVQLFGQHDHIHRRAAQRFGFDGAHRAEFGGEFVAGVALEFRDHFSHHRLRSTRA